MRGQILAASVLLLSIVAAASLVLFLPPPAAAQVEAGQTRGLVGCAECYRSLSLCIESQEKARVAVEECMTWAKQGRTDLAIKNALDAMKSAGIECEWKETAAVWECRRGE